MLCFSIRLHLRQKGYLGQEGGSVSDSGGSKGGARRTRARGAEKKERFEIGLPLIWGSG